MTELHVGSVVLRAEGITKVYGSTLALHDVDFTLYRGKVHALAGENGAGKSTLMGILAGAIQPTSGRIVIDGEAVELSSPRTAGDRGIRLIHQELLLFPNLSVAENIFAGCELRSAAGVLLAEQERRSSVLLEQLGQRINPRTIVGDLPVGLQQVVAICKALAQEVRVLIMDEPTSALSAREVESLFSVVRGLVASNVAVVYISHRLEEITAIGDFVTVLRDGRLVSQAAVPEIDAYWIIEQMIGHNPETLFPHESRPVGEALLEVSDVTLLRPDGNHRLDGVCFSVAAGEILGLYGLMGAGRTELLQTLVGLQPQASGQVVVDRVHVEHKSVGDRISRGLFLVPEDRQREGLVQSLSVKQNISLASLDSLQALGSLLRRREAVAANRVATAVGVKVASLDSPVTSLSGGNQQKVVVAKALLTDPKVLLMDDPMRGIDVGAKTDLYRIMQRLAKQGMAIVFTSSDLTEVLGMADRIIVLADGRITGDFCRAEASAEALVAAANPRATPKAA